MASPKEAREYFQGLSARLRDLTPASTVVAQETKKFIESRFESETDPNGTPWAPLRPATFSINPERRGGKILSFSGRLKESVSVSADENGISVSVDVPYAAAQNYGNPNNKVFGKAPGPVPSRRFLPFEKDFTLIGDGQAGEHWQRMREIILNYLLDGDI